MGGSALTDEQRSNPSELDSEVQGLFQGQKVAEVMPESRLVDHSLCKS